MKQYHFHKTKYGEELLIDLIRLESLEPYLLEDPTHRLDYYDVTLILDGEGTFSIDNNTQPVERGRIFFSAPGQVRSWQYNRIPEGYALIFEEEFLCAFFNDSQFVKKLSCFNCSGAAVALDPASGEFSQLTRLMQNIRDEMSRYQTKDQHILRALLYQTLMLLNRICLAQNPLLASKPGNRYVDAFIQLVNIHYLNSRSVDYYAEQLHITPGHLNDLVKKQTGTSAKQHILHRTMLEAKRLLMYTAMTVDEIAAHLNYASTNYFVRAFSKSTDTTPLRFRKKEIREK
ncbi:AraC-like DNA-binding protein [Prolixibacter denitrificans]|nr:AraC-like DNA-binding protein [Prolixibacter denitrificans]